jgi:hypothetical protein
LTKSGFVRKFLPKRLHKIDSSANCYNADECRAAKANLTENAFSLRNLTKFGTAVEYQCPLGREFYLPESGTTVKSQVKNALRTGPEQGCQMAYFQTKNPDLGSFLRNLQ